MAVLVGGEGLDAGWEGEVDGFGGDCDVIICLTGDDDVFGGGEGTVADGSSSGSGLAGDEGLCWC